MISKVIISHYENELFSTIFDYINVCKFRMKNLLILSLSFFILTSCEVSQSENVYTPPNNKIKPIENLIYYTDVNSLEIIKTKIKKPTAAVPLFPINVLFFKLYIKKKIKNIKFNI